MGERDLRRDLGGGRERPNHLYNTPDTPDVSN